MTIADLRLADGAVHPLVTDAPLPERFDELGAAGVMACAPKPVDPMEKVFHAMALHIRPRRASLAGSSRLVWPYPLTSTLLAGSQVWSAERRARATASPPSVRPRRLPICAALIRAQVWC